ncbi:MAG TPA: Rne/Rng family ribonuclease [Candidatus Binatia bacterium]|nr:Rne/Rng family ribonuclease [Candidatus Binatia bacterium]
MAKNILINVAPWETRVAVLEDTMLVDLHIERHGEVGIAGNIYKGRVLRVLPGMQAAFVDIGLAKAAFLHASDVAGPALPPEVAREGDAPDLVESPAPPPPRDTRPIEERLQKGQDVLVQVAKEPIGTKGARVTAHLSLPGRYLVYMPGTQHIGISRRIEDAAERDRLREIVEAERPAEGGLIVRTACEGTTKREIHDDVRFLTRLWARIQKQAESAPVPALIHSDLDLVLRTVRDLFTSDVDRLSVDRPEDYQRVVEFVTALMPRLAPRVHLYEGLTPIFDQHGVETKIARALERRVWLKSGGYLIFDQTESLTTVDVNTGRYVGKKDQEETILRTNLEAAKQIMHQLRLRNIGGIIVIDFIDMEKAANRKKVFDALQEAVRKDKARTNVLRISELGLVQMTRKRTRESLEQLLTSACAHCGGGGRIPSVETVAYDALRRVQREAVGAPKAAPLTLRVHPEVAAFLAAPDRRHLDALERQIGHAVAVEAAPEVAREQAEVSVIAPRPEAAPAR